ncbi:hypothetical protein GCM10009577_65460 [Streptomyces javensis]
MRAPVEGRGAPGLRHAHPPDRRARAEAALTEAARRGVFVEVDRGTESLDTPF